MNKILLFALLQTVHGCSNSTNPPTCDPLPNGNGADDAAGRAGSLGGVVDDLYQDYKGGIGNKPVASMSTARVVAKYGSIAGWNTAHITNMKYLFTGKPWNPDIREWDVSSVTNMNNMFEGTAFFNQDISKWDVSSVTNMKYMFYNALSFNQDISAWDVSSVTNMGQMFNAATSFNQQLCGHTWINANANNNVIKVPCYDPSSCPMFDARTSGGISSVVCSCGRGTYIQNEECILCEAGYQDQQGFTGSACKYCNFPLYLRADHTRCFNPGTTPLPDGNGATETAGRAGHLGGIVDDYYETIEAVSPQLKKKFTQIEDMYGPIELWDTSQVTNMNSLFLNKAVNQDISGWDVSSVTTMQEMFKDADSFNQNLSGWDVSSVATMQEMFKDADSFNQSLSGWNVSSVTDMSYMFEGAIAFNQDLNAWDVSSVTDMNHMFSTVRAFNQNLNAWDVSAVQNMAYMFKGAESFNQDISAWDVSSVTDMQFMFIAATSFNGKIRIWNVSSVTNMKGMFYSAIAFHQQVCSKSWVAAKNNDDVSKTIMFTDSKGTISDEECVCSPGFAFNRGECTSCTSGQYQDEISYADLSCKDCARDQYQNEVAQIACKVCASGQYSETAQSACSHPKCGGEDCTPQDLVTAYQARGNCGN
jgi:surface protein